MELKQSIIYELKSILQSYNDSMMKVAKNNIEATDYNSIHCQELGDADKQFSELYKEFNELIELNGQGLFETTQDLLKKHDIGNNIDDLDDADFEIYERLLDIYHEYDNEFREDILELIDSHPKFGGRSKLCVK